MTDTDSRVSILGMRVLSINVGTLGGRPAASADLELFDNHAMRIMVSIIQAMHSKQVPVKFHSIDYTVEQNLGHVLSLGS